MPLQPRVTPSGNVVVGIDSHTGIGVNPVTQSVGVGRREGNLNVGAGINTVGTVGGNVGVQGRDVSVGIGGGFNLPAGGAPVVTPTVQFGSGRGNVQGGQAGGTAGSAVGGLVGGPLGAGIGSLVGSAAGSLIGGAFNESRGSREHKERDSYRNAFRDAGLWDSDYTLVLPDGTVANFNQDSSQSTHSWRDVGRTVNNEGGRDLYAYETDYTNDLDYLSGMAGMALARIISGASNKPTDQLGQLIGNQALGSAGHGADFNQDTFSTVMTNMRAMYARAGINNKDDMLALANTMFSQGRVDDLGYATMEQVAGVMFDNDYTTAQALMQGRWAGIEGASQAEAGNSNSSARSPYISLTEAQRSLAPFFDAYRQRTGGVQAAGSRGAQTAARIAEGAGTITAIAGAARAVDDLTGGRVSQGVRDIAYNAGITDTVNTPSIDTGTSFGPPAPPSVPEPVLPEPVFGPGF